MLIGSFTIHNVKGQMAEPTPGQVSAIFMTSQCVVEGVPWQDGDSDYRLLMLIDELCMGNFLQSQT